MIPSQTLTEFPVFGDNSSKEAPASQKYAFGFVPGDVLPAEWLNWFLNTGSKSTTELETGVTSMEQEINSVLSSEGITPDATKTNQLLEAIRRLQPTDINENTTINPTKETYINVTAGGKTITLGTAPYVGYRLPMVILISGAITVKYTGMSNTSFTDIIYSYNPIIYEYVGSNTWKPVDGTTYRIFSAQNGANAWNEYRGPGTYTFFVSYTGASTDYDLPTSFGTITVTWGSDTTASAICVTNYHSAGNENNNTNVWFCNYAAGTWSKWTKIIGNGSGTVHKITSLASGWSGYVHWTVQNGTCTLTCYASCTATGTSKTVLTNVPKAKIGAYACTYAARGLIFVEEGTTTLKSHVTTANANQVAQLSYPVADDWVES